MSSLKSYSFQINTQTVSLTAFKLILSFYITNFTKSTFAQCVSSIFDFLKTETSPFYEMQVTIASRNPEIARNKERERQMQPLDLENDVPEGFECPMEMLQKLQELRMNKIEFELNIKYLITEVEEMTIQEEILSSNV